MRIVFSLLAALSVTLFFGFGVVGLLARRLSIPGRSFALVTGFAVAQLVFFPAYFIFSGAISGVLAAFAFVLAVNTVYLWPHLSGKRAWREMILFESDSRNKTVLALMLVAVLVVAAWPYLMSGWGNYWHSGNEDIMDALYGRDAYVSGQLLAVKPSIDAGLIVRDAQMDSLLTTGGAVPELRDSRWFTNSYIASVDRFQYSSMAFWSVVLGSVHGMDAFLIQAMLNLLLMAQGVYLLGIAVLGLSRKWAAFAACAAVLSNFYLTSYFNGHEGSLIYNSFAPFLLLAVLKWVDAGEWRWSWASLMAMWLLFLVNTYPYPLPYLVLPLTVYAFHRLVMVRYGYWGRLKNQFRKDATQTWDVRKIAAVSLLGFLAAAIFAVFAWQLFEPVRVRALSQFRSWGTIFNYVGLFQYWGIWPSSLASGSGGYLHQLLQSDIVVAVSALLAAALIVLTCFGFYRIARDGQTFFTIWLGVWLLLFPAMRFIVADSYYFYKFLYINSFVGVLALAYGCVALVRGKSKILGYAAGALVMVWVGANLINDGIGGWALAKRPYNQDYQRYLEVLQIQPEILAHTFIDIPRADHGDVLRQTISSRGLHVESDMTRALYLLRMEGVEDVVTEPEMSLPIWRASLFRLIKAPDHNLIHVAAYWEPELVEGTSEYPSRSPFRWVSDLRIGGVSIAIDRRDEQGRYLHFCAEPGPSLDYRPITLHLNDAGGKKIGGYWVSGYACHWVDLGALGEVRSPVTLSNELVGRIISPIEPRKLNYRISNVGVSPERFDKKVFASLAANPDVTPQQTTAYLFRRGSFRPAMLFLGNGWYNFERFAGESFRWVANDAEIKLFGVGAEPSVVTLDMEPGPSLAGKSLLLDVLDNNGKKVGSATLQGRQTVKVTLPAGQADQSDQTYLLHVESDNLPVPGDHRILNFRVFKIEQHESEKS
ncbi:MAG: hypothetical protein KGZ83_02065 [Sulfuricella sp.]|nr:hypothetical protein [Sulfuricella sp.]